MPSFSVHPDKLSESAKDKLTDRGYWYANSNAGNIAFPRHFGQKPTNLGSIGLGWTDRANREAFYRWKIVPKMLVDTNVRNLSGAFFFFFLSGPHASQVC